MEPRPVNPDSNEDDIFGLLEFSRRRPPSAGEEAGTPVRESDCGEMEMEAVGEGGNDWQTHLSRGSKVKPWVPDWSTVGPRFLGGNRGSPHKNLQPWVPTTSFLFCVRWATRPNCQPLTLSHLESDGGPTASMPSPARPHCILPARNLETLTIF